MKKGIVLTVLLCMALLCACSGENKIIGKVTQVNWADGGSVASVVIRTEEGEDVGLLLQDAIIFSWVDAVGVEDLVKENAVISAVRGARRGSVTDGQGNSIPAYGVSQLTIEEVFQKDMTLSDGTAVEVWQSGWYTGYRLSDGTELLREQRPAGPEEVHVMGLESLNDLNEAARANIVAFYDAQGLLYDVQATLEQAYADWKTMDDKEDFQSYLLDQNVSPSASSDRVMYLITTVSLPAGQRNGYELRMGAAFDRETGEKFDIWELFSCPQEEAIRILFERVEQAGVEDAALRAEMQAALHPENILVFPGHIEVYFPQGSLPSQPYSYSVGMTVGFDDALAGILHEWAIPKDL